MNRKHDGGKRRKNAAQQETPQRRHKLPVIEADPQQGLTEAQVQMRMSEGYSNAPVESNSKSVGDIVRSHVLTYFNLVFFVLAVAVILVGSWQNLTFMGVVIANIFIGVIQELRSKRKLDELNILATPQACVIRDGEEKVISVNDTVRDDIAVFRAGDQIYADAVIVDGDCLVNESLLTGEADELPKVVKDTLMSGSFLVSGHCRARLTAVGADSYVSQLSLQAKKQKQPPQSEMMRSLSLLVKCIGIMIIPLGALMAFKEIAVLGNSVQTGVVSTVGSLVGMIPEGLYLLTSLALVAGVLRLSQRNTLVHEMGCIETLARVDTLCVDKTGTITEAEMQVQGLVVMEDAMAGEDEVHQILSDYVDAMAADNETMMALKKAYDDPVTRTPTRVMPFTSRKKYGGVAFDKGESYLLGAPEPILGEHYQDYADEIEEYAATGCRVLLLAGYDGVVGADELNGEVMPLAMVLLGNKIRKGAKNTFRYFAEQGVTVKVISGDHPATVSEVAARADIPNSDAYVDARTLVTDEQIEEAALKYTIFGRVTPEQKRKLVRAMHHAGHTVAMTGDGVNDVLALKEADCSVAMASGSPVASQVSHIVLMNSDFSSMPSVVAEGRRIINNIERSASLYLVKNIFSLCLAVISLVFTFQYPISAAQMSLVSVVTIGIPSFVMAMEPNNTMIRGHFLSNAVYRAIPSALSDLLLCIGVVLFYQVFGLTGEELGTICTLVIGVVGLLMVHRTSKPYTQLRKLLMGVCVGLFCISAVGMQSFFTINLKMSAGAWLVLVVFLMLAFEVSLSAHTTVTGIHSAVQHVKKHMVRFGEKSGRHSEKE